MARSDGKTEKATPHQLRRAQREGKIPRSQEVGVAVSLALGALALRVFTPNGAEVLRRETAALFTFDPQGVLPGAFLSQSVTRMLVALVAPFLGAAFFAALIAGFGQSGFKFSTKAAMPKLSHLSPKKGLQRFKPATATWELVRTVAKLGLLVAIVWGPVTAWMDRLGRDRNLEAGLASTLAEVWSVLLRGVVLAVVIAAADYAWNRYRYAKDLRMSKDEIRREHKDTEGDPLVRALRRRRASELSRNRMLSDVARADVVVTNPTHLAIALRYVPGDGAPRVVAKGADKLALRIRAIAGRHGVPITEDRPLARALYRRCRVGQFVPAALYEAVAIILALAYRRTGRFPAAAAAGAPA